MIKCPNCGKNGMSKFPDQKLTEKLCDLCWGQWHVWDLTNTIVSLTESCEIWLSRQQKIKKSINVWGLK